MARKHGDALIVAVGMTIYICLRVAILLCIFAGVLTLF